MNDWRPIETAPKDGAEFVMLDNAVHAVAIGHWMADVGWRNAGKIPGEALAEPSWFPLASPTHWMPLPDAPS